MDHLLSHASRLVPFPRHPHAFHLSNSWSTAYDSLLSAAGTRSTRLLLPYGSLVPRSCREDWRKNDDKVNGMGTERDEVRDVGMRSQTTDRSGKEADNIRNPRDLSTSSQGPPSLRFRRLSSVISLPSHPISLGSFPLRFFHL